jgi:HEAT repeat protein
MPLFGHPDPHKLFMKNDVKGLLKALTYKGDVNVRRQAAGQLGYLHDLSAFEPLIKALEDPDESVRKGAAKSLKFLGDPRTFDTLIALLGKGNKVHDAAALALGEFGDKRAIEPIRTAYGEAITSAGNIALGRLGDHRVAGALIEQVKATRDFDAIWALGETKDARALPLLMEIALNSDHYDMSGQMARIAALTVDPNLDFAKHVLVSVWTTFSTNVFTLAAHDLLQADVEKMFPHGKIVVLSQHQSQHSSSFEGCLECKKLIEEYIKPSLPRDGLMPIGYELGDGNRFTYS